MERAEPKISTNSKAPRLMLRDYYPSREAIMLGSNSVRATKYATH